MCVCVRFRLFFLRHGNDVMVMTMTSRTRLVLVLVQLCLVPLFCYSTPLRVGARCVRRADDDLAVWFSMLPLFCCKTAAVPLFFQATPCMVHSRYVAPC